MKALPLSFYQRPAQVVRPDLIGCRLVKRQVDGGLLWGVIVETEAYSQDEPACHGYRRRSPQNETLFGEPGRFYVYVSYGIHHCVNVVTDRAEWAMAFCCGRLHCRMNRNASRRGQLYWRVVLVWIAPMTEQPSQERMTCGWHLGRLLSVRQRL